MVIYNNDKDPNVIQWEQEQMEIQINEPRKKFEQWWEQNKERILMEIQAEDKLNNMTKQTTLPKRYVVIDEEESSEAIVKIGTLEEIQIELENEWVDKMGHDWDTDKWINSLSIYELTKPTKLKYTRAKLEIK